MRVKEFGGQGDQGSCSLHSFLTNLFLPNLNDSQRPEQSNRFRPFPDTHSDKLVRPSTGTPESVKETDCILLLF